MSEADQTDPVRVGMVGAGLVAQQYVATIGRDPRLRLVAVADLNRSRAEEIASEAQVAVLSTARVLASDDVDVVLNLTPPSSHAEISVEAINAGKHVYSEKPLATDRPAGTSILSLAHQTGVLVGCAPDTVLGEGVQTARYAIERG